MEAFTQGDRNLANDKANSTDLLPHPHNGSEQNAKSSHSDRSNNLSSEDEDLKGDRSVDAESDRSAPVETDIPADEVLEPEAPSPIAWQVWTYLERHRKDTLQCIGTFDSEWKAQRFIADAERQNTSRLRVHYEIHPLLELEDEGSANGTSDDPGDAEEVPDAIDVEIMSDNDS